MSTWRRWLGETQATTQSLATFNSAHESLVRTAKATLPEGEWVGFLSIAMGHLVNPGLSRPLHALSVFYDVERAGAHVLPLGSYSPIPDTRRIPEATWAQPFDFGDAIDLRVEAQRELLADLSRWMPELADVPFAEGDARGGFYWLNQWFPPQDARVYYALLRRHRPKLVIEIGGGYSTMIAARAALQNGGTELVCVEPEPSPALVAGLPGLTTLLATRLHEVDLALFDRLGDGDVLFIDSGHAGGIGSDVNRIFFSILPRLAPGVLVHFHDVFLPWDYPRPWAKDLRRFFTEQYLLQAFLMFNRDYEVLLLNAWMARSHGEDVVRWLGVSPDAREYAAAAERDPALVARRRAFRDPQPASAWIRRRTTSGSPVADRMSSRGSAVPPD